MATESTGEKQLLMQKIYVKDLSFESPATPDSFTTTEQSPETQLNLKSAARTVGEDLQEVVLTITVETKVEDRVLFLVELQQAGLFLIKGYSDEERKMLVGSFCPATLYPYAREAISDAVTRGGFPQLLLQPINFDALYAQARQSGSESADNLN